MLVSLRTQQSSWRHDRDLELAKRRHEIPHIVRDDRLSTTTDGAQSQLDSANRYQTRQTACSDETATA
jgi:hypothetical protein